MSKPMPKACGCGWPCNILKILNVFSTLPYITAKHSPLTTIFAAVALFTLITAPGIDAAWPVVPFGGLKGPDELGVPECKSNSDCVVGGICVKDRYSKGRCLCSSSCPLNVPVQCMEDNRISCVTMGDHYTSKYDLRPPLCYHKRCVCPPSFDPNLLQPPIPGFKATLPMKCDRRELNAMIVASPSDSIYRGTMTTIFCCVNVDPRDFIPENGVYFVQNGTRKREPTNTPYENFSNDIDTLFTVPTCWSLHINNVQLSDSGTYVCFVQPLNAKFRTVNASMELSVKIESKRSRRDSRGKITAKILNEPVPRVIQNLTIIPNSTSTTVMWDIHEGPMLKIDLDLYRRSDRKTKVWHREDAKTPVVMDNLAPATPYTIFVTVMDGQTEPFRLTEQFQTLDGIPDPPQLEDIRLVNAENGQGQMCEVEWRLPRKTRGLITKYYVQITGRVRYLAPEGNAINSEDFPMGVDICSNDDSPLSDSDKYINPNLFQGQTFFACKYGPLKPNRNYSATIWAENKAGKSKPVTFREQCIMDFAEPDHIEPPETMTRSNMSSFGLKFTAEPDETNGPIACFYLAVIPLPTNVSLESLPSPELIVMDTFDKALQNNLHETAALHNRFFAYIAESYMQYPRQTVVGDGITSGGVEPCNVLYLSRYKPLDAALTPNLKYTGFLIARIDRDRSLQADDVARSMSATPNLPSVSPPRRVYLNSIRTKRTPLTLTLDDLEPRSRPIRRQLSNIDPAYGFSNYFKPVLLQESQGIGSVLEVFLIIIFSLLFILLSGTAVIYFLYKKGMIKQFCPLKKAHHDLLRPGIPPSPIKVEELPGEFVMRHRDSDYQFTQEFEMLPRGKNLDHTISERKENARKNRYNDIKAADATRIRLRKLTGDPSSDYINANLIKGYKNRKVFIATQGPLECTVPDFWRMVWEQGCKLIIMVTNLRERGREQCAKYWPDNDEDALMVRNTYYVRGVDSQYYSDYTVREFEICSLGNTPESCPSPPPKPEANGGVRSPTRNSISPPVSAGDRKPLNGAVGSTSPTTSLGAAGAALNNSVYSAISRTSITDRLIRPLSKNSNRAVEDDPNVTERRRVVQYHFTTWNDYKAPECTIGLLRLICKLRKLDEYNNSPVVVHCSAGVGRTGTLIAIDHVLDQCLEEGKADVFGCVAEMRQQRNLMVQSVEQFVFIYRALAEYQLFGDTDLTVPEFRSFYSRLRQPLPARERERHVSISSSSARSNSIAAANSVLGDTSSDKPLLQDPPREPAKNFNQTINTSTVVQNQPTKITLIEAEFNNLSISLEKPRSVDWSQKEENARRNRFPNAVPFNVNRVILSPMIGYENTYINASIAKGYFYPYILAQDPLDADTCFDFWRMINDNNTYIIVMLSSETEFLFNERYWPETQQKKLIFGKNEELINEKGSTGREVTQYSFRQGGTQCGMPNSPPVVLDLIGRVLERQSNLPDAGPIILHCRDGSAENGVFCCISLLLERLKAEHMIDVFRTVKSLQLQRPLIFNKLDQYGFCYDCVIEYLNSAQN
ncbi:protein-tyrosine phosphatase domain-containing protein [Ditylenchus destructor]|uniref:protein-tyrosine-phosphatase n=1 Tax=Ditylenchus destructor TaxID=166010 RepID=A0AAD4NHI6_9BILA|nr:protein-tyrosine phosphatase domain-containing protein [Ditylenchus destructor]